MSKRSSVQTIDFTEFMGYFNDVAQAYFSKESVNRLILIVEVQKLYEKAH